MYLLGIVERPGVSWGVLGCPGVLRLTPPRTIPLWNSLPSSVVSSKTTEEFKGLI